MANVICICGSLRKGSYNRMVMNLLPGLAPPGLAIREAPPFAEFPVYNADIQDSTGFPPPVHALAEAIRAADGVIFCTPEYNFSMPGGLKNAIDWVSRPPGAQVFRGKVATFMGASTGPSGTLRMQPQLRGIGANLGMLVLPSIVTVSYAAKAFGEDGTLVDEGVKKQLARAMDELVAECRLRKP